MGQVAVRLDGIDDQVSCRCIVINLQRAGIPTVRTVATIACGKPHGAACICWFVTSRCWLVSNLVS